MGDRDGFAVSSNSPRNLPGSLTYEEKQRVDFLALEALEGCIDLAAGGCLESENLLPDDGRLNVA
jgi:hypothetical protein